VDEKVFGCQAALLTSGDKNNDRFVGEYSAIARYAGFDMAIMRDGK
jgi:hypothetical protein